MLPQKQKQLHRLLSASHVVEDVLELLGALRDEACDIRSDLGPEATLEARKGVAAILTRSIDAIGRLTENKKQSAGDESNLDD